MIPLQFGNPVGNNRQCIAANGHEIGAEGLGEFRADSAGVVFNASVGKVDVAKLK